jgi:hypothetical protein
MKNSPHGSPFRQKSSDVSLNSEGNNSAKRDRFDAFISYRRGDATAIANWMRRKILNFRLPETILSDIPSDKQNLYARGPKIFLDTVYEKASDDWLQEKVFPALDKSDRLIVISTPFAFEQILGKNGQEEPNWLVREIDHFLGKSPENSPDGSGVKTCDGGTPPSSRGGSAGLASNPRPSGAICWFCVQATPADMAIPTIAERPF